VTSPRPGWPAIEEHLRRGGNYGVLAGKLQDGPHAGMFLGLQDVTGFPLRWRVNAARLVELLAVCAARNKDVAGSPVLPPYPPHQFSIILVLSTGRAAGGGRAGSGCMTRRRATGPGA
jgi:hypothetical protein